MENIQYIFDPVSLFSSCFYENENGWSIMGTVAGWNRISPYCFQLILQCSLIWFSLEQELLGVGEE
jgi:hypothetical protein